MGDRNSSEDEVFFGAVTEREIPLLRHFLGDNYNSPVTPRPPRSLTGLPDVLDNIQTSTPAPSQDAVNDQSTPLDDYEIIVLEDSGNSNSIITLSDDESFVQNKETHSTTSLVQELDKFINDSNSPENCSEATVDQINIEQNLIMPNHVISPSQSHFSMPEEKEAAVEKVVLQENVNEMVHNNTAVQSDKNSCDMSDLGNYEFSLDVVTQRQWRIEGNSILNISHGSSLPSPPSTPKDVNPVSVFHEPVYEDISYDGEQLESVINTNCSGVRQRIHENPDLHMSVDETDFQQEECKDSFGNSKNTSLLSNCKSFPSAQTTYSTAYNASEEDNSGAQQCDSFHKYRDLSTDCDFNGELASISIKPGEENKNERNFEMVMQNRQDSFNGSPTSKIAENNVNENKSKVVSKLPVYHSTKSLLKPAQLSFTDNTLKTSSYKFAKQISKAGGEKVRHIPKPESKKLVGPSSSEKHLKPPSVKGKKITSEKNNELSKTPAKIGTPKLNVCSKTKTPSTTESKIPTHRTLTAHTKSQNNLSQPSAKTPRLNISNIPRSVKSDSKVKRVLTPLSNCGSSGKNVGNSNSTKDKYKNIVSPVEAYIRGSPMVLMRVAQVEEQDGFNDRTPSKTQDNAQMKSIPKAMQKLQYENNQGQENKNPNVRDLARDTIPSKVLGPSVEVFWKKTEQPQDCLPKMGEKLTKLLAPPKIKLHCHEGRVNQSPNSSGVLVPNTETSPSVSEAHSIDGGPQQSEGRISVRIEKTIHLP